MATDPAPIEVYFKSSIQSVMLRVYEDGHEMLLLQIHGRPKKFLSCQILLADPARRTVLMLHAADTIEGVVPLISAPDDMSAQVWTLRLDQVPRAHVQRIIAQHSKAYRLVDELTGVDPSGTEGKT